jgi:hypothetical protein
MAIFTLLFTPIHGESQTLPLFMLKIALYWFPSGDGMRMHVAKVQRQHQRSVIEASTEQDLMPCK